MTALGFNAFILVYIFYIDLTENPTGSLVRFDLGRVTVLRIRTNRKLSLPKTLKKVYVTTHILQLIALTLRTEKGALKGLKGSVFRRTIAPA